MAKGSDDEELTRVLKATRLAASTERVTKPKVPVQKSNPRRGGPVNMPPPRRTQAMAPVWKDKKAKDPESASPGDRSARPSRSAEAPEKQKVPWDPKKLHQFMMGLITLGELEGISKDEQYEMAKAGHGYFQQAKLEDAKKVFTGLSALDPKDAYFHMMLGAIAQRAGEMERAEGAYNRALELNPFSAPALANRGEIRLLAGNLIEGAQDLLAAIKEDPHLEFEATRRAQATVRVVQQQLSELENPKKNAPRRTVGRARGRPTLKRGVRGRARPGAAPSPRPGGRAGARSGDRPGARPRRARPSRGRPRGRGR